MDRIPGKGLPCDEQTEEQLTQGEWKQGKDACPFCGSRKTWHYTGEKTTGVSGNHVCCSCGFMWE